MKKVTDNETTLQKKQELGNANQNHNSDYLVEITEIPNSPISVVKESELYFVVLGQYRLSEYYNTKQEAMADAKRTDTNRMVEIMMILIDIDKKANNLTQK